MCERSDGPPADGSVTGLEGSRASTPKKSGPIPALPEAFPESVGFSFLASRCKSFVILAWLCEQALDEGDVIGARVWFLWYALFEHGIESLFKENPVKIKATLGEEMIYMKLLCRWPALRDLSGVAQVAATGLGEVNLAALPWFHASVGKVVERFWVGHESDYRFFYLDAALLDEECDDEYGSFIPFEKAAAPPPENRTATPSWNKETMTLSYKGKHITLRTDAATRSDVFNWFEAVGWRKVKIPGLDIVENAGQVSNLVRRAKATARRIGFVIKRTGEELEWMDHG